MKITLKYDDEEMKNNIIRCLSEKFKIKKTSKVYSLDKYNKIHIEVVKS